MIPFLKKQSHETGLEKTMSFIEKKWITGSFLALGLVCGSFAVTSNALAQNSNAGLEDFSFDLDNLPPQPGQENAPTPAETNSSVEIYDPAATSQTAPLEPVTAETTAAPVAARMVEPPANTGLTPMDTPDKPSPEVGEVSHSGLYYDSDSFVPSGALAKKSGVREVDPKYEPGSRFVTVSRGAAAGSSQAKIVAAQRAIKLGRYTSALELYEDLYKKMPKNEQVLMGLAVSQQYSGFTESAIATYEELLKVNPKNTDATVNMFGLLQAQYPAVAYHKLKDMWEDNSASPAIAAQLGLTSASMGNNDDALKYLGIASSLEPHNASHFYNMAVIADQSGAYKDAQDLYEKALEVDTTFGAGRSIPREQVYDRLAKLRRL